jgi:hypothetical protein
VYFWVMMGAAVLDEDGHENGVSDLAGHCWELNHLHSTITQSFHLLSYSGRFTSLQNC